MEEKEIWVFGQQVGNDVAKVSLELLGKAKELAPKLGARVVSVLIGNRLDKLIDILSVYGTEKIYLLDDPGLDQYSNEAYVSVVADLIQAHQPEIFLIGATDLGRDLAPRVAARVGTGLAAHCIDLVISLYEGMPVLYQIVPGYGGESMAVICPKKRPQMATIKPGVFSLYASEADKNVEVVRVPVQLNDKLFRIKNVAVRESKPIVLPLDQAKIVISVGWGLCSLGSCEKARELADTIGGALGGTRPLVDNNWLSPDVMIGQSGKVVCPQLFISLGASGAMQFTTGFTGAKFVLAVDKNPEAPIFEVADIGITGDLREVLPCLIEEFRKLGM